MCAARLRSSARPRCAVVAARVGRKTRPGSLGGRVLLAASHVLILRACLCVLCVSVCGAGALWVVFGGRVAGPGGEGVSDELVTLVAKQDSLSLISIEHVCSPLCSHATPCAAPGGGSEGRRAQGQ